MRVRVLQYLRGADLIVNPRAEIDLDDELAAQLIAAGAAEEIKEEGGASAPERAVDEADVEKAVEQPARKKRAKRVSGAA